LAGFLFENFFKLVANLSTVASVDRMEMDRAAGNPPEYLLLWGTKAAITTLLAAVSHTETQLFKAGLDTEMAVILSPLFPLSLPCIIPPGIIGTSSSTSSVEQLRDILHYFLYPGDHGALSMLDSPLLHEWLHATHKDPLGFLTDWIGWPCCLGIPT
jgi:hypothetical protein